MYEDIADSKQAEEQIESLARFPAENPNPVLRIATDGTLLYANHASESLLKEWNCRVGQVVGECWRQWVSEAFESGRETEVETEHAGRTLAFAIAPVAEAGYANLYGRDITERKKVQDELAESEERFHRAVLESPFPIMIHADDGEVLQINKVWTELTGYRPEEIPTLSEWTRLAYGERKDVVKSRIDKTFDCDARVDEGEYVITSKKRESLVWDFSSAPLGRLPDGRRLVISIAKDVTEHKRAQEQIENLAKFPSENPNPVLRIARDGTLLYANDASESLLNEWNCRVGQVVGEHWRQWVSEVFESGSEKRVGTEHAGRTYSFAIAPVVEAGYANIYGRDITHRKLVEKEREQLLKTVAAKNQELQDIIYIASHDLKTPLVNILGFSGELLKDLERLESLLGKDTHEQSDKNAIENLVHDDIPQEVKFISSGAHMLKGLIDGMLQVSRIGAAEYAIEPLNMNELIKDVVDGLEFSIRDGGVSVTVEELPNCLGDAPKTSQLFGNLLSNALKYLDLGRKGVIRIRGRSEDGRSEYCVQDNGIGIDAGHQAKVFEVFHRLNPSDDIGGEGLGLTIAMRILDQMDGTICLESEPGKGSKFFVSLPGA